MLNLPKPAQIWADFGVPATFIREGDNEEEGMEVKSDEPGNGGREYEEGGVREGEKEEGATVKNYHNCFQGVRHLKQSIYCTHQLRVTPCT